MATDVYRVPLDLIDPGASDDEIVYCRQDDVRRWHDEIERLREALTEERERCAKIADERAAADQATYKDMSDWRQPYACNRVVRASMDIAAAIRKNQ